MNKLEKMKSELAYMRQQRVVDLALKAGLKKEHASDREYIGDFDWRLFSELLVKECIGAVEFDDGATHVRDLLLKHFGMEE